MIGCLATIAAVTKKTEPSNPKIIIIWDAGIVFDKSFMKKSSKEKRAMEPTINSTGWSVESFKIFSLMRGTINTQL